RALARLMPAWGRLEGAGLHDATLLPRSARRNNFQESFLNREPWPPVARFATALELARRCPNSANETGLIRSSQLGVEPRRWHGACSLGTKDLGQEDAMLSIRRSHALLGVVAMLAACTTNPYTGERQVSKTAKGAAIGTVAGAAGGAAIGALAGRKAAQ